MREKDEEITRVLVDEISCAVRTSSQRKPNGLSRNRKELNSKKI